MSEDGKVATPWTDKTKAQVQQVRGGGSEGSEGGGGGTGDLVRGGGEGRGQQQWEIRGG